MQLSVRRPLTLRWAGAADRRPHARVRALAGGEPGRLCSTDPTFSELYNDPKAALATEHELLPPWARRPRPGRRAGFAFTHERDIGIQNEYLLHIAKENARFIPLVTLNPGIVGWEVAAESWLVSGAGGFGELRPRNQGWDPLGPAAASLCALARDAGAVLLWHVSEPVGHAYPGKAGGISASELWQLADDVSRAAHDRRAPRRRTFVFLTHARSPQVVRRTSISIRRRPGCCMMNKVLRESSPRRAWPRALRLGLPAAFAPPPAPTHDSAPAGRCRARQCVAETPIPCFADSHHA